MLAAAARPDAELAGPDVPEKVWTRRSEARIGAIETRLREMQGEARRLAAENERLRGRLVGDAENARGVIDRQAAAIDELERRLRTDPPPEGAPGDAPYFRTPGASPSGSSRAPGPVAPAPLTGLVVSQVVGELDLCIRCGGQMLDVDGNSGVASIPEELASPENRRKLVHSLIVFIEQAGQAIHVPTPVAHGLRPPSAEAHLVSRLKQF